MKRLVVAALLFGLAACTNPLGRSQADLDSYRAEQAAKGCNAFNADTAHCR